MTYEGWLVFERGGQRHRLTVWFPEKGPTGVRDTTVFLVRQKGRPTDADPAEGWTFDPYDSSRRDKLMRNGADDERHDASFPDHPLTLVRADLRGFEASLRS
jgi:hypothetical protein